MSHPLQILGQLDSLIQIVDINSRAEWQTVQIQTSWLLKKRTDLDLNYLQRQDVSGFSRTRVKSRFLFRENFEYKKTKRWTPIQVYQVTFVSVKLQPKWLDIPQEIICTSSNISFFLFLYICSLIQRLNSYGEYLMREVFCW